MILIRYLGGKSRISKEISEVINIAIHGWKVENMQSLVGHNQSINPAFVSLFCGSCAVESKVLCDKKILNDKHEYLIKMFIGLQNGYELPDSIDEQQYKYIRNNLDLDPVLSGFVGFGCSFGGKWFGGYARNKTGTNYAAQSKRSLLKDMRGLINAQFLNLDYRQVPISNCSVVYADPPYKNTTTYGSKFKFDTDEFWNYIRSISKNNIVFVSEENAPEDFVCIWEKEFTRTLDCNKNNQPKKIEKLFVHNDSIYFTINNN